MGKKKRLLIDLIKDFKTKSSWIIQMAPKTNDKHPYRSCRVERLTETRRPHGYRGKNWSDTATKPRKACSHQQQEEARNTISPIAFAATAAFLTFQY